MQPIIELRSKYKERFEKALAEAQKTHDAYRSTPAGAIAQYYVALSQEGLGDTAKAIENLQQVVQKSDADIAGPPSLRIRSASRRVESRRR